MNGRLSAIVGLCVAQLVALVPCVAQQPELETNLKAAFLYNFTKYIDWPADPNGSEFVIGIVGTSDLQAPLEEIARSGTADNKKIVIRRFDRLDQISPCNVLLISGRSKIKLAAILARTTAGELTVGEESGTARNGTVFDFIRVGDKLKFEVNTKALESSGLKVSSQLLKLAIIVNQK